MIRTLKEGETLRMVARIADRNPDGSFAPARDLYEIIPADEAETEKRRAAEGLAKRLLPQIKKDIQEGRL